MEKISDERLISIRNDGEAGGTFAAADVLSMIGEIIYSRKRIAELLNAYYKLEADARVSQEFQRDVLMPLFDKLEQAGYPGTWSQKVDAVLNPWMPMESAPKDGSFILVVENGEVNKVAWEQNYGAICYPGSPYQWCIYGTYQDEQGWFATVDNPEGWMPLPLPPESEGK